uniref:Protein kinase domain-containing protein n=1 Tax=Pseudictyota dubia TaxID=2749911 RepID=A0A7R9VML9_9STRA|mmetsp:Transcript_18869/g.35045  ORF Transcript_18869/g.35045 Transcript_18869/m.35045 type:complete len:567 (+) Transcript_18869:196-1896(+)
MLNASLAEAEDVRFASSRDDASSSVVGGGAVTASPPRSPLMVEADLLAARVANLRSEIEARAEEADVLAAREASLRVKIMRSVSKECHPQRKQVTASLVEGNAAASTCTDFAKTISSPSPSSKLPKLGWNDSPSGSGLTVHAPAPLKTWPENVERTAKQGSASKTKPSPPSSSPSPSEPTPPPADPSSSQRLVATAEGKKGKKASKLLELSDDDVRIDYKMPPLGGGAFCAVYPIRLLRDDNAQTRRFGDFSGSNDQGRPRQRQSFALKRLRRAVVENTSALRAAAAADLRREAELLADCSHENVVRLHGTRKRRAIASASENDNHDDTDAAAASRLQEEKDKDEDDENFFIVLEKLEETLESRLERWYRKRGRFGKHFTPNETVVSRIRDVALGIARGMEYLHSKNIIFRGLKPANVGFDGSGHVKLFNFGLAQKCDVDPVTGSPYAAGRMGTLRYMAPEVAKAGGRNGSDGGSGVHYYSLSADVFSFALLLWQIVTSRVPYEHEIPTTSAMVASPRPIPKHKRPSLKYVESEALRNLLESSWAFNPEVRPTFGGIGSKLRDFIA